ncbi:MAG: phosphoribosyl-AMP cyclohydrolase [Rhodospirillaceae bacterium]|jgi:phosphoribosyl-AMP cyclohydrolase|nr:phosphoribosyl-AMP cyclohydrolase [Rhodospirillaceae bacterium]
MSETSPFAPRTSKAEIEEGLGLAPKFDSKGLIPCIASDVESGEVLMFAYMNRESLALTLSTGEAHYWSRSRGELWHKGASSGHTQQVIELRVDCDQDVVWIKVQAAGPACHVGYRSCFYRVAERDEDGALRLAMTEASKAFDPSEVYGDK